MRTFSHSTLALFTSASSALLQGTFAFAPVGRGTAIRTRRKPAPHLLQHPPLTESFGSATSLHATSTRKDFFMATLTASAAAVLTTASQPASAAKYGSFGSGSPEVLDPKSVDIDRDILESSAVQNSLSKIKSYQSVVTNMQSTLKSDPQVNLRMTVIKELDVGSLRETLNVVNSALEEDSQRGTDRLIRVILQDITEIETANAQKDGIARSPRRLEILEGKLSKLNQAFADYLAFFV